MKLIHFFMFRFERKNIFIYKYNYTILHKYSYITLRSLLTLIPLCFYGLSYYSYYCYRYLINISNVSAIELKKKLHSESKSERNFIQSLVKGRE